MARKQVLDNDEAAQIEAPAPRTRIPAGDYDAVCYKAEYGPGFNMGKDRNKRQKLYVWFRIMEGEHCGQEVFMAIPHSTGKLSHGSRMYKQWALAIGRAPVKGERFTRKVYLGNAFRIKVRLSSEHDARGDLSPDFLRYSVVHTILEPITGGNV